MMMSQLGSLGGGNGLVDSITQLILGQGSIQAQQAAMAQANQAQAAQNEKRAQHPLAAGYLKWYLRIAPWLVPGGGYAAMAARGALGAAGNAYEQNMGETLY